MHCRQVSDRLSCLIDGELPPREAETVKAHLESCPGCAGEVVALRDLRRRLRAWDESENGLAPSRSFRRRVVTAVRAEMAPPAATVRPTIRPAVPRGRLLTLAAGSLAAAALLIVAAILLVPSADRDPAAPATGDEIAARLAPDDVDGHLTLARRSAEDGREDVARGLYLRVLALDSRNVEALAALGLGRPADAADVPADVDRDSFRDRLRGIPTDRPTEVLVREEGGELDEERIVFEGRLLARKAIRDYIDLRELDRWLAGARASRRQTVAKGPDGETTAPAREAHVLAAFVARVEPIEPERPNSRIQGLTLLPVIDRDPIGKGPTVTIAEVAMNDRKLLFRDTGQQIVEARNLYADRAVFIPHGTLIRGRSQDRLTGRDVIVRADSTVPIPVLCCEKGQSAGRNVTFDGTSGIAGPGLRRLVLLERQQDLVWARIQNQTESLGVRSRTGTLRAVYEKTSIRRVLLEARNQLRPMLDDARVVGFVAADGDRILGADLFGSHALFELMADAYLDSYLVDALSDASTGDRGLDAVRARAFLQRIVDASVRPSRGVGEGDDAEFRQDDFFAYGLTDAKGLPVHVSLFPVRNGGGRLPGAPRPPRPPRAPEPTEANPPGSDGGTLPPGEDGTRHDPTEAGKRVQERRDRVREGAPSAPRPLDPPPRTALPGSGGGPGPGTPPRGGGSSGGGSSGGGSGGGPRDDALPRR